MSNSRKALELILDLLKLLTTYASSEPVRDVLLLEQCLPCGVV